jgi:hypothetical protein
MKLLRTIRLDPSDTFVFERAAEPGEWAVTGAFAFTETDPAELQGKARSAFRAGFLGVQSMGWSTLVQIVDATESDRSQLVDLLADRLIEHFGAPDRTSAHVAAEDEVSFSESLCTQPTNVLIAVHRTFENGEMREAFRTLRPRAGAKPLRAFSFFDVEDEDEKEPTDAVDLITLARGEGK